MMRGSEILPSPDEAGGSRLPVAVAPVEPESASSDAEGDLHARRARTLAVTGLSVIVGLFGFLGGWAALSPLESAAVTYGVVAADGNRKAVQHMDGGIVRTILVREGGRVSEGQALIELDQVQPRAAVEIYSSSVLTLSAVLARLEAEASRAKSIAFPAEVTARRSEPMVSELIASQQNILTARRTALASQVETLRNQIEQARSQCAIYRGQVATAEQQYRMVQEELEPKQMLFDKGYATNSAVMQLKRAATALNGQKQEFTGHIARLEHAIRQLESQVAQIENDHQLTIAQELEDARTKLADARERLRVSRDILDRTVIRAPVAGHVLGLSINTIGAVIARGDKMLEIVPDNGDVIVKGRLKATDGIEISPGMHAELRVLSHQGRKVQPLRGVVRTRSADARNDAATSALYYDIDVAVDEADHKALEDMKLLPGTPIEVVIPTSSRSVLAYIFEPISDSLRQGMRER